MIVMAGLDPATREARVANYEVCNRSDGGFPTIPGVVSLGGRVKPGHDDFCFDVDD